METKEPLALLISFIWNGIHKQVDSTINVMASTGSLHDYIYSAMCVCVLREGVCVYWEWG